MMQYLYQLILNSARAALTLQVSDGAMPSGHNGPYHDPETPVRNTSHWLIIFLKAHDISGEEQFLEAARRAISYLCSDKARPMGATFWHRKNPKKDACNGLIGQAWTIEALATAAQTLELPELLRLVEEIFLLHPFDESVGLWRRVGVDGTYSSFDMTFNHQLWFAAAGGLLAPYATSEIDARVRRFMDQLLYHMDLYSSGLIRHPLVLKFSWRHQLRNLFNWVRQSSRARAELAYKAVGYHAFNLYALALLKQQYPDHSFWRSAKFGLLWRYALSDVYKRELENNKYGYPYNPPGFEMAFALDVFAVNSRPEQERWLSEQFRRCYDFKSHMMNQGTDDPATYAARLYEATRLPNLTVWLGT